MNENTDNTTIAQPTERTAAVSAKRKPTVLQVLPALGVAAGVERGTVEVAAAIVAAGGRAIVASSGGPLEHELTRAKAEHVTLPVDSKNPLVMRANVGRLARLIEAEGVDIVHARSRAPAWSSWAAANRTGAHFVTTFHGTYSSGNWLKRKYNSIMTRGEKVIAISGFIAGHVRQVYGLPASRMAVIHRGVALEKFDTTQVSGERVVTLANEWRLPDGVPVVMLPGRLTRWKGQVDFIRAIAKLGRDDIRCVMVGSHQGRAHYHKELEAMIRKLGIIEIARIVDHCDDMPAAYMLADLVVSASTDPEAFGRVVAEAQAVGRPVVLTNHGGAREIIIDGETGWLTPPGDIDAMAAAIERGLDLDAESRRRMAERAVDNIRRNFSKESMCAKTLDVYNEVLDGEAAF